MEWSPIVIDGITLALSPHVRVDLFDGEALAAQLIETDGESDTADERLLHYDLLADWSDAWLVVERERYRQSRLHALETACRAHARAGRFARAVGAGMTAVEGEPLRESAHRALMTVFIIEGNPIEAVRQYHTYVGLARREMGIGRPKRCSRCSRTRLRITVTIE